MLEIYPIILSFVADIGSLVPRIAHHDPDLARQLRLEDRIQRIICTLYRLSFPRARIA